MYIKKDFESDTLECGFSRGGGQIHKGNERPVNLKLKGLNLQSFQAEPFQLDSCDILSTCRYFYVPKYDIGIFSFVEKC